MERRDLPQLTRAIEPRDIVCDAGDVAKAGQAVRCRIEQHTIWGNRDPSSLQAFCLGDYTECPTWRAEKERVWAGRRAPLVRE